MGAETKRALRQFQQQHGLRPSARSRWKNDDGPSGRYRTSRLQLAPGGQPSGAAGSDYSPNPLDRVRATPATIGFSSASARTPGSAPVRPAPWPLHRARSAAGAAHDRCNELTLRQLSRRRSDRAAFGHGGRFRAFLARSVPAFDRWCCLPDMTLSPPLQLLDPPRLFWPRDPSCPCGP